mmetsp:Transcript_54003/g.126097  ORF Transcript_54003/g.126097 Transcript_54003/m.126097 type:complete len:259 (-) Transcript_54003:12-788(-)
MRAFHAVTTSFSSLSAETQKLAPYVMGIVPSCWRGSATTAKNSIDAQRLIYVHMCYGDRTRAATSPSGSEIRDVSSFECRTSYELCISSYIHLPFSEGALLQPAGEGLLVEADRIGESDVLAGQLSRLFALLSLSPGCFSSFLLVFFRHFLSEELRRRWAATNSTEIHLVSIFTTARARPPAWRRREHITVLSKVTTGHFWPWCRWALCHEVAVNRRRVKSDSELAACLWRLGLTRRTSCETLRATKHGKMDTQLLLP